MKNKYYNILNYKGEYSLHILIIIFSKLIYTFGFISKPRYKGVFSKKYLGCISRIYKNLLIGTRSDFDLGSCQKMAILIMNKNTFRLPNVKKVSLTKNTRK